MKLRAAFSRNVHGHMRERAVALPAEQRSALLCWIKETPKGKERGATNASLPTPKVGVFWHGKAPPITLTTGMYILPVLPAPDSMLIAILVEYMRGSTQFWTKHSCSRAALVYSASWIPIWYILYMITIRVSTGRGLLVRRAPTQTRWNTEERSKGMHYSTSYTYQAAPYIVPVSISSPPPQTK